MIKDYSSKNNLNISKQNTENALFSNKLKNHQIKINSSTLSSSSTIINDTSVNEISTSYKKPFPHSIEIIFNIENTKLPYDYNTVLSSCPTLNDQVSKIQNPSGTITINLPTWIKKNDLLEYFFYYKNGIVINNKDTYYRTMLKLSDFFNNCDLLNKIINTNIIPNLNYESALIFLVDSYQNINDKRCNQNSINNTSNYINNKNILQTKKYLWYELFYSCKEYICDNLIVFISNPSLKEHFIKFREDLLESIIAQYLKQNTKTLNDNIKAKNEINVDELLYKFILEFSKVNNIYDVINKNDNENSFYCTENENISYIKEYNNKEEIKKRKMLSFLDNNNYPLFDYYFDKNIKGKIIIPPFKYGGGVSLLFSITYDSTKDCVTLTAKLNYNIKCNGNKLNLSLFNNILSVTFYYFFNNNEKNLSTIIKPMKINKIDDSSNINIIPNIKDNNNEYILLSIYSFSKMNLFKLSMYVKLNFIHSFLINYFVNNVSLFYNDINNISKLSVDIVKLLLISVTKENYNNAICLLLTWFHTIINEDIFKEIFPIITWENVNKDNIYYFVMKYITLIQKLGYEDEFIKKIKNKIDYIIIKVAKEVNYYHLYQQKVSLDQFMLSEVNSIKEISTIRNSNKYNNILEDSNDKLLCNELLSKDKVSSRNKRMSHSKNNQCQSTNSNKITMSSSQPRMKPIYSSMTNKELIHNNNNVNYCNITNNSSNYFTNK